MDESEQQDQPGDSNSSPSPARSIGPLGAMGEAPATDPREGNGAAQPDPMKHSVGPMGELDSLESLAEPLPPAPDPEAVFKPEPPEPSAPQMPAAPESAPGLTEIPAEGAPFPAEEIPLAPPPPTYADVPIAEAVARVHQTSDAQALRMSYVMPGAIRPLKPRKPLPAWVKWPVILVILGFAYVAGRYQGWDLRKQVYKDASGMHWGDVGNAFNIYGAAATDPQGTHPAFWDRTLFNIYQKIRSSPTGTSDIAKLDYPPLRLAVMSKWISWARDNKAGNVPLFSDAFNATEPLLRLNFACEIVSAILVFALIWLWTRRMRDPNEPDAGLLWPLIGFLVCEAVAAGFYAKFHDVKDVTTLIFFYLGAISLARMVPGLAPALAGAMFLWFNPAVIWDAYAWPQWDVWIFPFMLGALLLASVEFWFCAGVLIAIGALLKGQLLLVSPVFLLWPLFRWQWKPMVRFAGGFLLTFGVIIFPWMLPSAHAIVWLAIAAIAMGLLAPLAFNLKMNRWWIGGMALAAVAIALPWTSTAPWTVRLCVPALLGLVAIAHFAPRNLVPSIYAIALACAIFLMIPLFSASNAWYTQGYRYGTEKFPSIGTEQSGPGGTSYTNNLPVLLARVFTWRGDANTAMITIDFDWMRSIKIGWMLPIEMSARNFMLTIYGICLVLCGIGAAIHSKRRDSRLLACAVAPWICSFVLLTQLNNRYLVWAAGMSALLAGVGVGMTLLGVIVTLVCWIGMIQLQYAKFSMGPELAPTLAPLSPHLGWMLTLAAAVYLYVALVPGPRRADGEILDANRREQAPT